MTGLDDFTEEDTAGGIERIMVRVVSDDIGNVTDVDGSEHALAEGSKHTLTETVAAPLLDQGVVERVEGNGQLAADSTEDVETAAEEPDDSDAGDVDETDVGATDETEPATADAAGPWGDRQLCQAALLDCLKTAYDAHVEWPTDDKDRDKPVGDLTVEEELAVLDSIPQSILTAAVKYQLKRSDLELRYLDDTETWWVYNAREGIWMDTGERYISTATELLVGERHYTGRLRRELDNKLESDLERDPEQWLIDREDLGGEPGSLLLDNGVLDLTERDSGLRAPRSDDYFLNRLPTAYDPDAEIEGTRFQQFIDEAVAPEDVEKLQEFAGYCLWRGAQPHKRALFLIGPTDSGKGTFLKTLELVIGRENVAWQTLYNLIQSRWGAAKIYGKMVNFANEVSTSLKNVERFKELTGGEDTVTAENKHQPTFQFVVTQKLAFATNRFPRMSDADGAFFNRCLFVQFPDTTPPEEQEDLLGAFDTERSAILNWMLEGLDRLRERGYFANERDVDAKRGLTKSFGSPTEQFTYDYLEITGDSADVVHKGELHDAFTRFCDFDEAIEDTVGQTAFTTRLKKQSGITDGQSVRINDGDKKEHVYQGIRVDVSALKQIQADIPRFATADGETRTGDGEDDQPADPARQGRLSR